jgi:hypothetical protein
MAAANISNAVAKTQNSASRKLGCLLISLLPSSRSSLSIQLVPNPLMSNPIDVCANCMDQGFQKEPLLFTTARRSHLAGSCKLTQMPFGNSCRPTITIKNALS